MNWTIIATLLVAIIAGVFATVQAVIASRRAKEAGESEKTTKTIEIGVTALIDQYREANEELRDEVHHVTTMKDTLEADIRALRAELNIAKHAVERMVAEKDNLEAEIIRLKRKCGELP